MKKIIKAGAVDQERRAVVEAPLYDARLSAEQILADANADAERVRRTALEDADRLRQQAQAEGRERGLGAVTELLVGARAAAARGRAGAEPELRTLAVRIAEKLLGRELTLRPDAITDVVLQALCLAGDPREVLIRVHPDDLAALERGRPRLIERCRSARAVSWKGDEAVPRGGCVLDTELGFVDARLSTQLDAIERALKGDRE